MSEDVTSGNDLRCCIKECPLPAVETEETELSNWSVIAGYCHEHARELKRGIPMGLLAIDGSRLEFRPRDAAAPRPGGGIKAVSPQ